LNVAHLFNSPAIYFCPLKLGQSFYNSLIWKGAANGLRYLRVGGRGQCLGAEKLKARKMPVNRADSQPSAARCVGQPAYQNDG